MRIITQCSIFLTTIAKFDKLHIYEYQYGTKLILDVIANKTLIWGTGLCLQRSRLSAASSATHLRPSRTYACYWRCWVSWYSRPFSKKEYISWRSAQVALQILRPENTTYWFSTAFSTDLVRGPAMQNTPRCRRLTKLFSIRRVTCGHTGSRKMRPSYSMNSTQNTVFWTLREVFNELSRLSLFQLQHIRKTNKLDFPNSQGPLSRPSSFLQRKRKWKIVIRRPRQTIFRDCVTSEEILTSALHPWLFCVFWWLYQSTLFLLPKFRIPPVKRLSAVGLSCLFIRIW